MICQRCNHLEGFASHALYTNATLKKPDGKFILAQERRLMRRLQLHLTAQKNYVLRHLKGIFPNKVVADPNLPRTLKTNATKNEFTDLPYKSEIAEDIYYYGKEAGQRAIKTAITQYNLGKFGVGFNKVSNKLDVKLKDNLSHELSNAKGNINDVTLSRINDIVYNGYINGDTYGQIANEIEMQGDAGVFSPARSKLIAVHEIGWAYEDGKYESFDLLQEENPERNVVKMWNTVGDGNVTPTHTENEELGWVPLDFVYEATGGDDAPPASDNPNCRCMETYDMI